MKVVILAGGFGTRLGEDAVAIPKPMVEIGGYPILWHILKGYAAQGFDEFVLALGHKADVVKRHFLDYDRLAGDIVIDLRDGKVAYRRQATEHWRVHLIDTGRDTLTGGRIRRLRPTIGGETFMLTYGDGVSNVPIHELLAFHRARGRLATITVVRPPARFGGVVFDAAEENVLGFAEKLQVNEGWINGGFMVLEPGIFDYLAGDADVLEVDLLERLAQIGQLAAFRHEGFWQCMDTPRDRQLLERLWAEGHAPWRVW